MVNGPNRMRDRLLAGLGGAVLLAGCVSSPSAPGSASPTGEASPLPQPVAYGSALLVQGTDGCVSVSSSVSSPDPDGVTRISADLSCTMRWNDPRVSGTRSGPLLMDAWSSQAFVQWGGYRRVEGAAGDWIGGYRGIYTLKTGDRIAAWFEGVGSYAGSSFFEFIAAPPGTVAMGHPSTGLIFPGPAPPVQPEPPSVPAPSVAPPALGPGDTPLPTPWARGPATLVKGTELCTTSAAAPLPTTNANGEFSANEVVRACTAEFNDARVTGFKFVSLNYTGWGTGPDAGAFVEWGTARIETADGTWEGSFRGAYTAATGDMVSAWFEGTGAYEGLSLFEWIDAPPGTMSTGYPVIGLIFPGLPPPR